MFHGNPRIVSNMDETWNRSNGIETFSTRFPTLSICSSLLSSTTGIIKDVGHVLVPVAFHCLGLAWNT
jgi:hypothetical protein